MIEAKIRLSANEMELVLNAGWILTKNGIMEKAKWLLEDLQPQFTDHLKMQAGSEQSKGLYGTPKISKGENYKGLPYLVLDYPRIFHKENTLAIRTMFWWGNFFSTTLHLAGNHKEQAIKKIIQEINLLKDEDFRLCISEGEWEHHFEISNYIPLKDLSNPVIKNLLEEKKFIKIAKRIPLQQWDDAAKILVSNFKLLSGMIVLNSPADGKVL